MRHSRARWPWPLVAGSCTRGITSSAASFRTYDGETLRSRPPAGRRAAAAPRCAPWWPAARRSRVWPGRLAGRSVSFARTLRPVGGKRLARCDPQHVGQAQHARIVGWISRLPLSSALKVVGWTWARMAIAACFSPAARPDGRAQCRAETQASRWRRRHARHRRPRRQIRGNGLKGQIVGGAFLSPTAGLCVAAGAAGGRPGAGFVAAHPHTSTTRATGLHAPPSTSPGRSP